MVAAEPISPEDAQHHPLVAIPESLLLTTDAAQQLLGPALERQRQAAAQRRPWWALGSGAAAAPPPDPTMLLALLLASERRKGADSFWAAYIASLPADIPCGWALGPAQLAAELRELGPLAAGWEARVAEAAAVVGQRCEAAAAAYGPELGGLEAGELRWALGQVVSRCFGTGGSGCGGGCDARLV